MTVTHLNTYSKGGAALAALRIHMALRELEIDSNFLSLYKDNCNLPSVYDFRDELNSIQKLILKIKNKSLQVKNHRKYAMAGELFCDLESVWNVNQHSLVKKSDLIHLHWIDGFIGVENFFTVKNRRYIWTVHDHFPFSGGFHYPPEFLKDEWRKKIQEQKKIIKKIVDENQIQIVVPSEHLKDVANESGLVETNRIDVIKNTINESVFKPLNRTQCRNNMGIREEEKVIFFLSDHIHYKRKGFHILKEALDNYSLNITLLVAGKGNITIDNPKVKVMQLGPVYDENKLAELYNCANLLVNPSLDDISSNTIIEAMACGIPAIAFNSGGIPELISPENGLLVKDKNAVELARSITKGLETNFIAETIRKKAIEEHSGNKIAKKYLEVYRKMD